MTNEEWRRKQMEDARDRQSRMVLVVAVSIITSVIVSLAVIHFFG